MKNKYSLKYISKYLGVETGKDLVFAVAVHFTFFENKDKFTRQEIFQKMKSTPNYYRATMSNNLSKYINKLVTEKQLNKIAKDNYTLSPTALYDMEIELSPLIEGKVNLETKKDVFNLYAECKKIKDEDTRRFIEEAIGCCKHNLYLSAVIMSWLSAVDVLQKYAHAHRLVEFNKEAKKIVKKWENAVTIDDIRIKMKEAKFLECIKEVGMIDENVKDQLKERLRLRNSCGHPSTLKIGSNAVANHIEILILNVFQKFHKKPYGG